MTEILFTLTTIYVAYVVYSRVNGQKASVRHDMAAPTEAKTAPKAIAEAVMPEILVEEKIAAPVSVKTAPVTTPIAPKTKPATKGKPVTAKSGSVRNPQSGDVASASNHYRFTKRWIKEALVTEGLLDKVYKNNELDTDTEAAIKSAMATFLTMEKYRA